MDSAVKIAWFQICQIENNLNSTLAKCVKCTFSSADPVFLNKHIISKGNKGRILCAIY